MTKSPVDNIVVSPGHGASRRALWPLDPTVAHLNHGSFGAAPHAVIAAQQASQLRVETQPCAFYADMFAGGLAAVRAAAAAWVGADPEGLVLVENATQATNAVLASLSFGPGAKVLVTDHGYNAVRQALRYWVERRGGEVVTVALPCPLTDLTPLQRALTETKGLALAIIDHITSPSAAVLPVAELAATARAAGVPLLIDGAHAPGQVPLAVAALGADFYTGNFHKWAFAPKGAAFLSVAPRWREQIHPLTVSHHFGTGLIPEFDWVGTRDASSWLALPAAFEFHTELGAGLMAENQALAATAGALLAAAWGTEGAVAEPAWRGAMASVALPPGLIDGMAAALRLHDRLLAEHRIEVPILWFQERGWLRVSAQAYNELAEYERLAAAICRLAGRTLAG